MAGLSIGGLVGLVCAITGASFAILWVLGLVYQAGEPKVANRTKGNQDSVFLFHGDELSDCDGQLTDDIYQWSDLHDWLSFRFQSLPITLPQGPDAKPEIYASILPDAPARVVITPLESATRVELTDEKMPNAAARHEALRQIEIYDQHIAALDGAPYPICKTDDRGHILWQNAAYRNIRVEGDKLLEKVINAFPGPGESKTSRVSVSLKDQPEPSCYELHSAELGGYYMHYGMDTTRVVQAEAAQRQFVQTLTKTFANLTTGLAMFDRKQQLVLFNPALIDLTDLPAEFLSARPTLMGFFDNLRDRQVMPEPKNYANWRAQITHVIETASDGLYLETWSLPNGLTYRVTGRPHPDGAVAFLFEDISAEISLTRRFRAQLDIRQSVMDALDEAVVVISPNNTVMFCNQASVSLLGVDPDTSFADMSTRDLFAVCNEALPDNEYWEGLRTHLCNKTFDQIPKRTVIAPSGKIMACQILPISGGAAMLSIKPQVQMGNALQNHLEAEEV